MNETKTVLLAEANEDNRTVYRTILEHFGYGVLEARNGEDAIRMAREDHPWLVIMSRSLPLTNGWEAATILKGDPATSDIPIIGMSAAALPTDHAMALECGCDAFLPKPCEPRRVIAEVERLIGPGREAVAQAGSSRNAPARSAVQESETSARRATDSVQTLIPDQRENSSTQNAARLDREPAAGDNSDRSRSAAGVGNGTQPAAPVTKTPVASTAARPDKPVAVQMSVHSDEPTNRDSLDREQYAEAFARLVGSCDTPLVIGLYGTWGIGKTSLMRLIQAKLDPRTTRPVWFDAWRHQFDEAPALSLLHTMVDTFGMREEAKKLLTVIAGAFGSIFLKATTALSMKDIDELGRRYEEEQFEVRESRIRLHEHFRHLIQKAQSTPLEACAESVSLPRSRYHRVRTGLKYFAAAGRKLAGKSLDGPSSVDATTGAKRIIFFIDDLDRCSPANVLSMLESLKLHLNVPGCVYIIAMDRAAVERNLAAAVHDSPVTDVNYLDKIIQLPFTIPPIARGSMQRFIEPLLTPELSSCKPLLVKGLGDNPRHVKRFINILALNNELAKTLKIANYSVVILALLLLVQYRNHDLYKLIAHDPDILFRLVEDQEDLRSDPMYQQHIATDARLLEVFQFSKSVINRQSNLKQYIYLTQAAAVADEAEDSTPERASKLDLYTAMATSGEAKDIDYLMMILDSGDFVAAKSIDYALSLVRNSAGSERLQHYLMNGTPTQRNYAALYFKRREKFGLLNEAVNRGTIDRQQAFSK